MTAPDGQSYYLWSAGEKADTPHGPYANQDELPLNSRRSDLKISQTPREFQAKLLEVAAGLGVDVPAFCRKINQCYGGERQSDDGVDWEALDREVAETIVKVYVAMRNLGYSWRDLCG